MRHGILRAFKPFWLPLREDARAVRREVPDHRRPINLLATCACCSATTHTDLELRARAAGITVKTIHNASIMNAIGAAGLQLYRYGEAISIVFFTGMPWASVHGAVSGQLPVMRVLHACRSTRSERNKYPCGTETWRPDSFYDRIVTNKKLGLHTLCLLDIKVGREAGTPMSWLRITTRTPPCTCKRGGPKSCGARGQSRCRQLKVCLLAAEGTTARLFVSLQTWVSTSTQ